MPPLPCGSPPSAVLTRLGSMKSRYRVSFSVPDTEHLSTTKDLLLRSARRQLHYTGHYFSYGNEASRARGERTSLPAHPALPLLQDIVLFEALEPERLAQLAAQLKPRSLEPADVLFAQDGRDATLFIVASGILKICRRTPLAGSKRSGLSAPAITSAKSVCSRAHPMRLHPQPAPIASSTDSTAVSLRPCSRPILTCTLNWIGVRAAASRLSSGGGRSSHRRQRPPIAPASHPGVF